MLSTRTRRHLILSLVLAYKAIQATLGMDSILPYAAAAIVSFLASVLLLFVYLSRRVGEWAALAAVLPVLVMGTAYQDLLTTFQICYFGSMALGLGALLAIESADRRGDLIACALLVASLAFSEIALAFAAGVLVAIVLQHGPLRRAWTVAVPFVVYAVWYLSFGALPRTSRARSPPTTSRPARCMCLTASRAVSQRCSDWGRRSSFGRVRRARLGPPPAGGPRRRRDRLGAAHTHPVARLDPGPGDDGLSFWLMTAANFGLGRPPTPPDTSTWGPSSC